MDFTVGNVIRQPWMYQAADGKTPLTGQTTPANITFSMRRYVSTGSVVATETITFPETATAGYYDIVFTPQNSGVYTLFLHELAGTEREWTFNFQVAAVGAAQTPSYANAFCSETDIERRLQKSIDSTTSPSDTETIYFAQSRAMILRSVCGALGYPVSPATVTQGSILEGLLRAANEIGASLDYELAQQLRVSPNKSDRIADLSALWFAYVGGSQPGVAKEIVGLIEKEIQANLVALATDNYLSGSTQAPAASTTPTGIGIQVTMGDVF